MNRFFTSDLHFGHANIIKHCRRPFATVEEMDEALIHHWQARVKPGDEVYVLGDLSFHRADRTNEILRRLPGQKFLIKGNHDHRKELKKLTRIAWWKHYHEVRIDGQLVVLSHFPFETWNCAQHGSYHLHGHSHGTLPPKGKRMDVGVDPHDFGPILWSEVDAELGRRSIAVVDHHVPKYAR